jgi:hypothetical protein
MTLSGSGAVATAIRIRQVLAGHSIARSFANRSSASVEGAPARLYRGEVKSEATEFAASAACTRKCSVTAFAGRSNPASVPCTLTTEVVLSEGPESGLLRVREMWTTMAEAAPRNACTFHGREMIRLVRQ